MDPDQLLKEILGLVEEDKSDLSEKVASLNEWIMKGGLLPAKWRKRKIQNIVSQDRRNVADEFKAWENDLIKEYVKAHTLPFAVAMYRTNGDFNFSSVIRNANFFGAKEVFHFGSLGRHFDSRGTVGVKAYTDIKYLKDFNDLIELRSKYKHFVAIENNIPNNIVYYEYNWQPDTLVFLGEEGKGLSKEVLDLCDSAVFIPRSKAGTVRSINVACASSVIFSDINLKLRAYL